MPYIYMTSSIYAASKKRAIGQICDIQSVDILNIFRVFISSLPSVASDTSTLYEI